MNYAFLLTGFGLLLCGAFIDGSRSPLLPVLSHSFNVNYQQASLFLVVGYFTSVVSTSLLIPIYRRIGARNCGLLACGVTLGMGVFSQLVNSYALALLLGVVIACGSSSMGAMANVYVLKGSDLLNRGRFMAGLHTMYGLGAQAGPLAVAAFLSRGFSWQTVFTFAAIPTFILTTFIFARVPKDKASATAEKTNEPTRADEPFKWLSLAGLVVLMSAFYVAAEVLISNWMVTFLVETRGFTVERAAPYLSGYFWAIAITRGLCFVLHTRKAEKTLLWGSLTAALIFFGFGMAGNEICFPLAGVIGPFFPLMLSRMSHCIPEQAEAVSIRVMACMQLTLAVCNLSTGTLVDMIGAQRTYYLPALFLVGTIVLNFIFVELSRKSVEGVRLTA